MKKFGSTKLYRHKRIVTFIKSMKQNCNTQSNTSAKFGRVILKTISVEAFHYHYEKEKSRFLRVLKNLLSFSGNFDFRDCIYYLRLFNANFKIEMSQT